MAQYYGVVRSGDSLSHYGIKGMKWGVRKAIAKGDREALSEAFTKASKELANRKDKANLLNKPESKRSNRQLIGVGLGTTVAGGAVAAQNVWTGKHKGYFYPVATGTGVGAAGIGALSTVAGIGGLISDTKASRAKGHAKAVKKVQEWDKAMKEAFKGTEYEKLVKIKAPKYEDKYRLVETKGFSKKTGRPIEKTVASISGSHLVKNYKGADKDAFLKKAHDNSKTLAMRSPDDTDTNANYYFKDLYKDMKKKERQRQQEVLRAYKENQKNGNTSSKPIVATSSNMVVHPLVPYVPQNKKKR